MQPMLNIASRAAREAGNLILDALSRPDRIRVYEKGQNDFVTDIDRAVEETLIQHIRKAYPEHGFICEESGTIKGEDPDTTWIIDPIDGTRNFIHGFPHFCISIACMHKGKMQHGLIVDPVRGDEFSATRGNGAQLNDKRIRVSERSELSLATVGLSSAGQENYETCIQLQERMQGKVGSLRFTGSLALDMAYVSCGRLDAGWVAGMKLWDIAAGALLIQEAGGLVSDTRGNPDIMQADSLIFGNPKCFKQLLKIVAA